MAMVHAFQNFINVVNPMKITFNILDFVQIGIIVQRNESINIYLDIRVLFCIWSRHIEMNV